MSNLQDVRPNEVKVYLGGKERVLNMNFNTYAELEDIYGDINTALEKLQTGSIKAIRAFVYAALKEDEEDLTLKKVGKMLDMYNIEKLTTALNTAISVSLPAVEEKN